MRQTYGVEHGLPVFADAMRGRLEPPGRVIEEALAREDSFEIEELDLTWFKEHRGSFEGSRWEGLLEKY